MFLHILKFVFSGFIFKAIFVIAIVKKMARYLIAFILSIWFVNLSTAQEKSSFAVIGEYSENFSWRNYAGGFSVEVQAKNNLYFNYKLLLGGSSKRAFYLHSPAGAAIGTVLLSVFSNSNPNAINTVGVLLYLIPEGITYYPKNEGKSRAGIYFSPLGVDYWKKRSSYEYFKFTGEIGGKFKYTLKDEKLDLLAYGGLRYIYNKKDFTDPMFLHAGLGLSFRL